MKFLTPLILGLAAVASAIDVQKSVIITYPDGTPDSIMDQAKETIRQAGGIITHEYTLLKGFAAKGTEKVFETVSTMSTEWQATVEDDQIISINS